MARIFYHRKVCDPVSSERKKISALGDLEKTADLHPGCKGYPSMGSVRAHPLQVDGPLPSPDCVKGSAQDPVRNGETSCADEYSQYRLLPTPGPPRQRDRSPPKTGTLLKKKVLI
jgi:hypothetical protein